MREIKKYIDAEILKQQDFQDFSNTDVFNAINDCPAAKVRGIVYGKWIRKETSGETLAICDYCGFPMSWWNKSNFCPNCGAYMRGDQ